ncbi:MAG: hypothetical protein L6Q46_05930 [Flavobacterium sp.]|uniref:hypothetical protein n=1 Tax=Flavobacterium sp. TaxID=239 RepID=UPI0025B7BCF8|nr:hypothetical protein [Flavobacterium sp.]MCK6607829.1 hypothetical protein [Flavobacterium sp.]
MKKLATFILLLISSNIFSQSNKDYTCEEIKSVIIDEILYNKLSNGKLVANLELKSNKIYKIIIENEKSFYYVSKSLMKKIKKSIKKNNCLNIKITKVDNIKEINFKIIRD